MTPTENLSHLRVALDENPKDWDTRLIYADLLEETGDREFAVVQRWMAEFERHPFGIDRYSKHDWWVTDSRIWRDRTDWIYVKESIQPRPHGLSDTAEGTERWLCQFVEGDTVVITPEKLEKAE